MLYTEAFTKWSLCAEQLLNTDTRTLLSREDFTLKLNREASAHRSRYTEQPLHTDAFRHGSFYTQKLAHTEAFTRRSRYTEQLLHTETFALHTEAFKHRSFHKEKLLHKAKFAVHLLFSSCARAAKRFGPGSSSSSSSSRFAFCHTFAQRTHDLRRALPCTNKFRISLDVWAADLQNFRRGFHVHQPNSHFPTFCHTFGHPTRTISAEDTREPVQFAFYHTFGLPTCAISGEGHVLMDVHGAAALGEI